MDIKENFKTRLESIREGLEKGNPNIVRLRDTQAAAKKALGHVKKNNHEAAHAAVKGTPLAKHLRTYLSNPQKHRDKTIEYLSDHASQLDEEKIKMHGIPNMVTPKNGKLRKKDRDAINVTNDLFSRMDALKKRKVKKNKKLEEEQLNELRGKSSLSDDERKELKDRIRKKHGKAWNDTIGIRKEKKSSGPADTRDMDKLRDRLARMYNKLDK
jgi:hypothetical protein